MAQNIMNKLDNRVDLLLRLQRATLDSRHVEQITNQTIETVGLVLDRLGKATPRLFIPLHIILKQTTGGGLDRGQRRTQVVGSRREQGRAQRISTLQELNLHCLAMQTSTLDHGGRLIQKGPEEGRLRVQTRTFEVRSSLLRQMVRARSHQQTSRSQRVCPHPQRDYADIAVLRERGGDYTPIPRGVMDCRGGRWQIHV